MKNKYIDFCQWIHWKQWGLGFLCSYRNWNLSNKPIEFTIYFGPFTCEIGFGKEREQGKEIILLDSIGQKIVLRMLAEDREILEDWFSCRTCGLQKVLKLENDLAEKYKITNDGIHRMIEVAEGILNDFYKSTSKSK